MKKSLILFVLFSGITSTTFFSCKNNQNKEESSAQEQNDSSVVYPADEAVYGHLGEGTGMSCLEFITNQGDTLELNKTDESTGKDGIILGEIANYTDQYALVTSQDSQSVAIALNVNQLMRSWQSSSNSSKGMHLIINGDIKPINEKDSCQYNKWELYNCKLVLLNIPKESNRPIKSDTIDIISLTLDSMTVQYAHSQNKETFYPVNPNKHGKR